MSQTKTLKITPICFDHLMIEICWSDFKCVTLELMFYYKQVH
jgi:hypothetical protein